MGDSISLGVPYEQAAADVGFSSRVRAAFGWSLRFHRVVDTWTGSTTPTLTEAAASPARAVVVELGTNDVACEHYDQSWCKRPPPDDDPGYPAFQTAGRAQVVEELDQTTSALVGAGKCVVWIAPRHPDGKSPTVKDDSVSWFAGQLGRLVAEHPGRVFDAGYDAASHSPGVLRDDFAYSDSDGVHPRTDAGRQAIADLAVRSAVDDCASAPLPASPPGISPSPPSTPAPAPPALAGTGSADGTSLGPARQALRLRLRRSVRLQGHLTTTLPIRVSLRRAAVVRLAATLSDGRRAFAVKRVSLPRGTTVVRLRLTVLLTRAATRHPISVIVRATTHGTPTRTAHIRVGR